MTPTEVPNVTNEEESNIYQSTDNGTKLIKFADLRPFQLIDARSDKQDEKMEKHSSAWKSHAGIGFLNAETDMSSKQQRIISDTSLEGNAPSKTAKH